jgi:deaminated glutathione amidase
VKVAAVQMVSGPDVQTNLRQAAALIAQAAECGAELVALPEYFCLMGHRDRDKLAAAESTTPLANGPIQATLSGWARQHGIWLIGGTLPLRIEGDAGRVHNSCLVFDPQGRLAARYDKIHLFRFDDGERRYDEAATLQAGTAGPVAFDCIDRAGTHLRVGLSVCYDLRFPELYRALMHPPCDLLVVPAAFTHPTGEAHWELLLRARAVENQCHVLAPAQGGLHENGRRTWGQSMVVGPWGQVLAQQAQGEGVVLATVDLARQRELRQRLPALEHRRL